MVLLLSFFVAHDFLSSLLDAEAGIIPGIKSCWGSSVEDLEGSVGRNVI